jgi:CDP-diacylglycerol---serine O-phosphatidyltransferase
VSALEPGDRDEVPPHERLGRDLVTPANALTTGSLVAGFVALVVAAEGRLALAAVLIGVAATCDALDGLVARRTKTECLFGCRLDSLADLVSFGAAPAMMLYAGDLRELPVVGLAACVAFFVCGAWRLARFSLVENRDYFVGLAIPPAGVIAVVLALSAAPPLAVAVIATLLALLMISTIHFPTLGRLARGLQRSSRREVTLTGGGEAPEPAPRVGQ